MRMSNRLHSPAGFFCQTQVCRNKGSHLRGNLYVQFRNVDEAVKAARAMHERYYGGKQIFVQFSPGTCGIATRTQDTSPFLAWSNRHPVVSWRSAICGQYLRGSCSRGDECNFLHPFRNPGRLPSGKNGHHTSPDLVVFEGNAYAAVDHNLPPRHYQMGEDRKKRKRFSRERSTSKERDAHHHHTRHQRSSTRRRSTSRDAHSRPHRVGRHHEERQRDKRSRSRDRNHRSHGNSHKRRRRSRSRS